MLIIYYKKIFSCSSMTFIGPYPRSTFKKSVTLSYSFILNDVSFFLQIKENMYAIFFQILSKIKTNPIDLK